MAKSKVQKKVILRDLEKKIDQAKSIIFVKFEALTVSDNNKIREDLKAENGEYYVAKKTLLKKVLAEKSITDIRVNDFDGQLAVVFGYQDEVAPAKIIDKFRKDHEENIEFLAGILGTEILDKDAVEKLAQIPGKEELYAKLVASINAPISGLVNTLAGSLSQFLNVLKAIEEKKA